MKLKAFGSLAALLLAVSAPALAERSSGETVDDGAITTEVKAGLVGAKGVKGVKRVEDALIVKPK